MQSPTNPSSLTPPPLHPHTSSLTQSQFTESFVVPPPTRDPSPPKLREPQVSLSILTNQKMETVLVPFTGNLTNY